MVLCEIITPWTGDGTEDDVYRPLLMDQYRMKFSDATGQPSGALWPQPNIFVIWAEVYEEDVDLIKAGADFYVLYVGDESDQEPSAQEFGQLRSYLGQQGMDQEAINAAIGNASNGRSRSDISNDLKTWLRGLHV